MLVIDCYYSHIFILFISFIYSMNKSHANHKSLCECAVINQTAIAPIFLLCLWKLKSEIQAMIPAIHVLQVLNQIHAILFSTVLTRVLFQIDRQINRFIIYVYVCPSRSVMSDSLRSHGLQPCRSPLSMGFSRQEYWSGLPFPSPGDLPDPAIQPRSPELHADSFPSERTRTQLLIYPCFCMSYCSGYNRKARVHRNFEKGVQKQIDSGSELLFCYLLAV